ncbi:hypothetical protein PoB_001643300 [Plakobranchus ocellatus]|uniref:Uncharacterized protein n=1 Tax=Plakobranchus ocellatus TaxID=259542 RepID=A0AAV3Z5F3_9GAST|nr:hypothetical protein PoB_001643300 [Plakobranchus ocellatus]
MANFLIMPYVKNNQDPTSASPMLGLSVGPTLLSLLVYIYDPFISAIGLKVDIDCIVDNEPALRSPGTSLSQVRALPPMSWPDGGGGLKPGIILLWIDYTQN